MKYEIKNQWSGELIYSAEADSWEQVIKEAIKSGASLQSANLRDANLWGANLQSANLRDANLWGANLEGANLRDANLRGANLRDANLWDANLQSADLRDANLQSADLRDANLQSADLRDADLRGANLWDANLEKVCGLYQIVPEEGSFIGFKKLRGGTIAKIQIPEGAGRVGGYTDRKCRAEKAYVLEGEGTSQHDSNFKYKVGEIVVPDNWNPDPREVCAGGIHFFITRREAEEYN